MLERHDLLFELQKDIQNVENRVEHSGLYNLRNYIITVLINAGIVIDYALPFILSGIIIFSLRHLEGNTPFIIDEVSENAKVKTTTTSTGLVESNISYYYEYGQESFQYSTGWKVNEYGYYERSVTSYKINDSINLDDTDKIFSMSKKEIEDLVEVIDVETIYKGILSDEDSLYNEDVIIITNISEDSQKTRFCEETSEENELSTILYLIQVFMFGSLGKIMQNIVFKTYVLDALKEIKSRFKLVKKDELEKILELRKENMKMLESNYKSSLCNGERNEFYKVKKI